MPRRLDGGAPTLVLEGRAGQRPERGFGTGAVDLLRRAFGLGAERVRVGDLVPVTVSSDNQGAASPLLPLPPTGGYRTEGCSPWFVVVEGGVEDGFCSGFDEVAALGQGLLHVGDHGAGGFGNQSGDETRGLSCAAGAGGSGGGVGEAVVDDGGDVVGVANPRALMRRGSRVSTLWWLASARRSSADRAPKASESMTACACSSVSPEPRTKVVQRSCWAAAAMVSYSAAS